MTGKIKRICLIGTAVVLAGCFTVSSGNIHAFNVKKKVSSITLTAGSSKKAVLKGKALKTVKNAGKKLEIKCANKKVAKVTRTKKQKKNYSFTVKALKKGNTVITVKYKKKNVKIKVKVKDKETVRTPKITDNPILMPTPAPSVPTVTETPNNQPAEPTARPLRTRITVPRSEPETVGDYTKLTDLTTYSIDGRYSVNIWSDSDSRYYYNVVCDGLAVVEISPLGLVLSDTDLSTGLVCDNTGSYVDEIYEEFMVLYHGCIAPGGECRTYPNILTTEAVLGEENRKWSNNPSSENCLLFPFTRNILGSMDYTPACKDIKNNNGETEGFAIAKSVVYESGLLHLAAPAKEYRDYAGLPFLQALYPTWDESFIPDGEARPGEFITYVRRHGTEWFLGSMTKDARTMSVKLDFLESGKTYTACIYSADEDGLLTVEERQVTAGEMLDISLGKLDGTAVYIAQQ